MNVTVDNIQVQVTVGKHHLAILLESFRMLNIFRIIHRMILGLLVFCLNLLVFTDFHILHLNIAYLDYLLKGILQSICLIHQFNFCLML